MYYCSECHAFWNALGEISLVYTTHFDVHTYLCGMLLQSGASSGRSPA